MTVVAAIAVAGYGVSFVALSAVAALGAAVAAIILPRGAPTGGTARFTH